MFEIHKDIAPLIDRGSVQQIIPNLQLIETVRGCGAAGRPCRICCDASPEYINSLPFETIEEVFMLPHKDKQELTLFRRGDPAYYASGVYTIADVVEFGVNNNWSLYIRTHGWLPTEEYPAMAMKKLVNLVASNPGLYRDRFKLDFSLDTYGFSGLTFEKYIAAVTECLRILRPLNPKLQVYSNPNDPLTKFKLAQILHNKDFEEVADGLSVHQNDMSDLGRGRSIIPRPPRTVPNEPWSGFSIDYDGSVIQKAQFEKFYTRKVGSVYSKFTLLQNLKGLQ